MTSTQRLHCKSIDWLLESQLAPYVDPFTHYLSERRYASHTIGTYLGCVAHFGHWMSHCRLDIHRIDEGVVRRFLDDHLPQCDCAITVRRTRHDLRAALKHLLVVLRAEAVIAEHASGTTPADEELRPLRRPYESCSRARSEGAQLVSAHGPSFAARAIRGPARCHLGDHARRRTPVCRPPERAAQHPGQRRFAGLGVARLFPLPHRLW